MPDPTAGGHPEEQQTGNSDSESQRPGQVAVHVDCPAVKVGDRFSTFQNFKACMRLHAILNGYSIRFVKSDKSRTMVQCGGSDQCGYKVRAVWNKEEEKEKVRLCKEIEVCLLVQSTIICSHSTGCGVEGEIM
jgi:hypothetical protein